MDRVDVHCHTYYSNVRLIDAIPSPESLIDYAIEIGLKGVAITDHELVGSHVKALKYMESIQEKHPDFKLILGNEIYLTEVRPAKLHPHFILLAKDKKGHDQLQELSSRAWMNSYSSYGLERVDTLKEELEEVVMRDKGHLIASSSCLGGEVSKLILALDRAEELGYSDYIEEAHNSIVDFVLWCKKLFGEDFYFEVQPNTSEAQIKVNKRMLNLSKAFDVKMICTSDAHYLKASDRFVHKSFLNSKEGEREVDEFYADAYLHNEQEMIDGLKASGYSEEKIYELFRNSMEIYDKVERYSLFKKQQIPLVDVKDYKKTAPPKELKEYPILSEMYQSDDIYDRYWINQCVEGLKEKNLFKTDYLKELEEEADVKSYIGKKLETNMFRYPILLQHYYDMIWDTGTIIGIGRGSAAAALNHYLLNLTQIDPVEYRLPFWRYMNRENVGLGD